MRFLLTSYLFALSGLTLLYAQSNGTGSADASSHVHQVAISIPQVSLVNVVDNAPIHLNLKAPAEAGNQAVTDTATQTWLNYSFIKSTAFRPVNHVYVRIGEGQIPSGLELEVVAEPYTGSGDGDHGQPTGTVSVTTYDQKVVEDIGSSYTGSGVGNGHLLHYHLEISDYSQLDYDQDVTLQLVYTISE